MNFLSLLARKEANINIHPKEIKTDIATRAKNTGPCYTPHLMQQFNSKIITLTPLKH